MPVLNHFDAQSINMSVPSEQEMSSGHESVAHWKIPVHEVVFQLQLVADRLSLFLEGQALPPHEVRDCLTIIQRLLESVRGCETESPSRLVANLGLIDACRWYVDLIGRWLGKLARFETHPDILVPPEPIASTVFRFLQAALTDISRRDQATQFSVFMKIQDQRFYLTIWDDAPEHTEILLNEPRPDLTINLITERALALGGHTHYRASSLLGTTAEIVLPLEL